MPSLAVRPAFLAAAASPFLRSVSRAFSRSPPHSTRADLQSIIPAPVSSRSLRTISAEISIAVPRSLEKKAPGHPRGMNPRSVIEPRGLSGPPETPVSGHGDGSGDRARLRLAASSLILGGRGSLVCRRALRRPRLAQTASGQDRVGHPSREQLDRAQGVVVAGDHVIALLRVALGVPD